MIAPLSGAAVIGRQFFQQLSFTSDRLNCLLQIV